MARSTMEVAFLGTQRFDGENGQKYIKVFYGDEPDGKTEHGLSIIGMAAEEDAAEEIFAAGTRFESPSTGAHHLRRCPWWPEQGQESRPAHRSGRQANRPRCCPTSQRPATSQASSPGC